MRKLVFQTVAFTVLTGLSAYAFQVGESNPPNPLKENEMITAKKMSGGFIPPIDAAVPSGTQTATFALG